MNKVLINAGGGYVGQVLTEELIRKNFKVTIVDRFFYKNKEQLIKNKNLKVIKDDVRKINPQIYKDKDIVIDLTNVSIAPIGNKFFDKLTWEIDYFTRKRNILIAKKFGVKKFLYPSSCSVYGFNKKNNLLDENSKLDPKSTYAKAQAELEKFALNQGDKNFSITILRLPTVFGVSKRTRFDVIINALVFDALEKKKLTLLRDGKQRRPFVHVRDVARAFIFFINNKNHNYNNQIFNIGDEENNINLLSLANKIFKLTNIKKNIIWYGKKDDRSYYVSFKKIKKIGFKAKYNIDYGIKELKKAFLSQSLKRDDSSINIKWLENLELNKKLLQKNKPLKNSTIKILKNRIMYNEILNINNSKKFLIFLGANRGEDVNVAIKCIEFLIKEFYYDTYLFVVTDNDKKIILYLKKNNLNYLRKEKIPFIFKNIKNNEYDWLLNIWGHCVFSDNFLKKFKNNLNIHPSYLPYGKGRDSSLWTVIKNFPAGTTLHKMTKELDAGPLYCQKKFNYKFPVSGKEIYFTSCLESILLFINKWSKIRNKIIKPKKQSIKKSKTYLRSEMLDENLIDLDKKENKKIREFIIKSLAHDFTPNFNLKIKYDNNSYNFQSFIKKIN